jgi:hypothetical protein
MMFKFIKVLLILMLISVLMMPINLFADENNNGDDESEDGGIPKIVWVGVGAGIGAFIIYSILSSDGKDEVVSDSDDTGKKELRDRYWEKRSGDEINESKKVIVIE